MTDAFCKFGHKSLLASQTSKGTVVTEAHEKVVLGT